MFRSQEEKEETAEPPAKRGRKAGSGGSSASKRLSSLAKEAEAILKVRAGNFS